MTRVATESFRATLFYFADVGGEGDAGAAGCRSSTSVVGDGEAFYICTGRERAGRVPGDMAIPGWPNRLFGLSARNVRERNYCALEGA